MSPRCPSYWEVGLQLLSPACLPVLRQRWKVPADAGACNEPGRAQEPGLQAEDGISGWDFTAYTDRRAKADKGLREGWLASQSLDLREQARQRGRCSKRKESQTPYGRLDHRSGLLHGRMSVEGQTFPWPYHEVGSGACAKYTLQEMEAREVDGI